MDKSIHWTDAGATTASGSATPKTEAELLALANAALRLAMLNTKAATRAD